MVTGIQIRRIGLRVIWIAELMLFTYGYFFHFDTAKRMKQYITDIARQESVMQREKQSIEAITEKLKLWEQEPWFREKEARSTLRLGTSDEEQYIIRK